MWTAISARAMDGGLTALHAVNSTAIYAGAMNGGLPALSVVNSTINPPEAMGADFSPPARFHNIESQPIARQRRVSPRCSMAAIEARIGDGLSPPEVESSPSGPRR